MPLYGGGRRLGIVEITLHDRISAHQHLPVAGDADLHAVAGRARGGGDLFEGVARPRGGRGPGLGEPVAGHDRPERQLLAHAADEFDGYVRGPGDRGAQR